MSSSTPSRQHACAIQLFPIAFLAVMLALPHVVAAAPAFEGTDTTVRSFFRNINGLLNIASVAVVTIAVIFAGYQIAFAHKRIADVAPILVGGFLIGAAAQIANMLIGDGDTATVTMLLQPFAASHA